MNRTRLRTWVGRHPVWAANLLFSLCLVVTTVFLLGLGVTANERGWRITDGMVYVFLLVDVGFVSLVTAFVLACVRVRSGLSMRAVAAAAAMSVVTCFVGITLGLMAISATFHEGPLYVFQSPGLYRDLAWIYGGSVTATELGALVGLAAGAIVSHIMLRTGRWETIHPVETTR